VELVNNMSRADRAASRKRRQDTLDLVIASRNGDVETVTSLLARGTPPNDKHSVAGERPNLSALFLAALYGHSSVVTLLLAAPSIDVNAPCVYEFNDYTTALIVAAARRHTSVVTLLLAAPGISVNAVDGIGMTALCSACRLWDANDLVSQLLAHPDVDVNLGNQYPLYHAAMRGITSVVSLLLADTRVLVDALDVATEAAVRYNHHGVLSLLLADQRVHLMSDTLYIAASAHSADLAMVGVLLSRPDVNVNHRDTAGQTPLSVACHRGEIPIAELIFSSPALDREYFFIHLLGEGAYNRAVRNAVFNGCLGREYLDLASLSITESMAKRLEITLSECTGVTTVDLRDNPGVNGDMVSIVAHNNPRIMSIRFSDRHEIRNEELDKRQRKFVQEAHDHARYLYQITRRTNMDLHHVAHIGAMAFPEKFVQRGPDLYERAKSLLLKLLLIVDHEPPPPHMLKRLMGTKFVERGVIGLGVGVGFGLGCGLGYSLALQNGF
jgi:ankyrin repeat protein